MIKLNNLNKYYNKGKSNQIHVINNTTLSLPDTGLISFLGPSGCGKTTLLNVIGGLDSAKGEIQYDELKFKKYKMDKLDRFRRKNIGYVFQNYNLLPNETVYDNLAIALRIIDVTDKEEVEQRIVNALKAVGMYKYRKKLACALSGGQQQRVAIARALLKNAKIIIADEPTGNLDSENTIEVMNILKKISKKTLVLLVTHDQNIARFYADQIIELSDGRIIKNYFNDFDATLSRDNINYVYLKDLEVSEQKTNFGTIKLYHDAGNKYNIDIEIIVKNGNFYLQSNQPLKFVENANLKIINDHYRDLDVNTIQESEYEAIPLIDKKQSITKRIIDSLIDVKSAFYSIKKTGRKGKLLYLAFLLMGVLLALSVICATNVAEKDTSNFVYAENNYQITTTDHTFTQDPILSLKRNFENGAISNIGIYDKESMLSYKHQLTFNKSININLDVMVAQYHTIQDEKIISGRSPESINEVVLDEVSAEFFRKEFGNQATLDDIIGLEISLSDAFSYKKVIISGVCATSQKAVFTTDDFYQGWVNKSVINYFGNQRFNQYEVNAENQALYEVVAGRDVQAFEPSLHNYEVLVPYDAEPKDLLAPYLNINGRTYVVVGIYKYSDEYAVSNSEFITNIKPELSSQLYDGISASGNEYIILEGRKPSSSNECIVSIYNDNLKIGDEYKGYKIVGIYNGTTTCLSTNYIIDKNEYILQNYQYDQITFTYNDKIELYQNEIVMNLFDKEMRDSDEKTISNIPLFKLLFVVLLVINIIFVFLVMRSKMLSEIYSIGIFRALGASKRSVIKKFLIELIIIVTSTTVIGYTLTVIVYNLSSESVNFLLKKKLLFNDNFYPVIGLFGLYALNVIIGLLPLLRLLRHTPSEIYSKYGV